MGHVLEFVVKVKDKASQFTVPQKLGLAYTFGSTSAVARQWNCDNNTVRRIRTEVAQTYLRTQSRVLELSNSVWKRVADCSVLIASPSGMNHQRHLVCGCVPTHLCSNSGHLGT